MGYESATACRLLATHCVVCGRPLLDARSVELGIGPECREGIDGGIDEDIRTIANEHIFNAAIAAQNGNIPKVLLYADLIEKLGLPAIAEKVRTRFEKATQTAKFNAKIEITERDGKLNVKTPFRRGRKDEFVDAMREIPGRRYKGHGWNQFPVESKVALWKFLREFFPGVYGMGPKGVFRVPVK